MWQHFFSKRFFQAVGWLSLVTVVRFLPWFLFGQTLFFGDLFSLFVPGKLFSAEWFMKGETPYWNPFIFGGVSWWGDISQSVAYPSTWLFGWLAPAQALMLTLVSHWWLLLVGTYLVAWRLSRRHYPSLIAAVFFAASPPVTSLLHNLPMLQTVTWLPWVILAALAQPKTSDSTAWWRWLVTTAAVIAVQWYAGYPTLAVIAFGIACLTLLLSNHATSLSKGKHLVWFLMATALGTVWAMPALWPFIQTLLSSTRVVAESGVTAAIKPAELLKMLFPFIFELPWWGVRWGPVWTHPPTPIVYGGSLLFAVVGVMKLKMRERILVGTWLLVLVGAVVVSLLADRAELPLIRLPVIWHVLAQWAALMMGIELIGPLSEWWRQSKGKGEAWAKKGLLAIGVVVCGLAVLSAWIATHGQEWWQLLNTVTAGKLALSAFHTVERDQLISLVGILSVGVLLLSAAGSMLAWRLRSARGLFLTLAAELLITSQVSLFFLPPQLFDQSGIPERVEQTLDLSQQQGWRVLTRSSNAPYADLPGYWEALAVRKPFSDSYIDEYEIKNGKHLMTIRQGLPPNWHQLEEMSSIKGYGAFIPNTFTTITKNNENIPINALPVFSLSNPVLSQWATRYYVVDRWYPLTIPEINELVPVYKKYDDGRWQVFELRALPRVRGLGSSRFNLDHFDLTANTETAQISYEASSSAMVVFADRFEPGWSVTVDGQPVTAINHESMKAIVLLQTPIGQTHLKTIRWEYAPPGLAEAQSTVILSLLLLSGVGFVLGYTSTKIDRD